MIGNKFGILTVIREAEPTFNGKGHRLIRWVCECECGNTTIGRANHLQSGAKKSCGCLRKKNASKTHGMYGTRTHTIWQGMVARSRRQHGNYKDVNCCDHWLTFKGFYSSMGECPEGMSLDRVDPYGHYCPENCRWATLTTQARNKRLNKGLTSDYRGVSWEKARGKWVAGICLQGKRKGLGRYAVEADAAKAYDKAIDENGLDQHLKNFN